MGEVSERGDVLYLEKIINFYTENGLGKEGNCFLKENPFFLQSSPSDLKKSRESSSLDEGKGVVMVPSTHEVAAMIDKEKGKVYGNSSLKKGAFHQRGRNSSGRKIYGGEKQQPDLLKKTDWKSLIGGVNEKNFNLQFVEPKEVNGKIVVNPSEEAFSVGLKKWEDAVIGQFMTKKPHFLVMQRILNRLWGKNGSFQIFSLENGIFMFKFDNPDTREMILQRGSWIIAGLPMFVYKWRPNIQSEKLHMNTMPIWIKLHNVPPEYWCEDGISCLASAIGVPMFVDEATKRGNRMSFMRVCVEISVDSLMPSSFAIQREDKEIIIAVEYTWKPKKCSFCKIFGHNEAKCLSENVGRTISKPASPNTFLDEAFIFDSNLESVIPKGLIEGSGDSTQRIGKGKERAHVDGGFGVVGKLGEGILKIKDDLEFKIEEGEITCPGESEVGVSVVNSISSLIDEVDRNMEVKEVEGYPILQENGIIQSDEEFLSDLESLGNSPGFETNRFKGLVRLDILEKRMFSQKKKRKKEKGDKGIHGSNGRKDGRSSKRQITPWEGHKAFH